MRRSTYREKRCAGLPIHNVSQTACMYLMDSSNQVKSGQAKPSHLAHVLRAQLPTVRVLVHLQHVRRRGDLVTHQHLSSHAMPCHAISHACRSRCDSTEHSHAIHELIHQVTTQAHIAQPNVTCLILEDNVGFLISVAHKLIFVVHLIRIEASTYPTYPILPLFAGARLKSRLRKLQGP